MKKFTNKLIILSIALNIFLCSFFITGFSSPLPSISTKIHSGNGFEVYRINEDTKYLYVVKSTDGNPVAIR